MHTPGNRLRKYLRTPSPVYLYTVKIENFRHTLMSSPISIKHKYYGLKDVEVYAVHLEIKAKCFSVYNIP